MFVLISVLFDLQIQDQFEEPPKPLTPVRLGNLGVVKELEDRCGIARNPQARELFRILRNPHFKVSRQVTRARELLMEFQCYFFQSLIYSHDQAGDYVYKKLKNPTVSTNSKDLESNGNTMPVGETIKMVGIRKNPNEPLGLTVELDEYNQLIVARILAGGMIDRQGLLNPGDVILEVNGVGVKSPEELQNEISRAKESVTLKIGPNVDDEMKSARLTAVGGSAQVKSKAQEAGKKLAVSTALKLFFFS